VLPGEDSLFNFLDMNTKQAKAAPLHEFLAHLGHQPTTIRGNDLWYKSPFRVSERTPSFKIDRAKNVWYDHGLGVGGTIIDFVQQLNQVSDISRVLSTIEDVLGNPARLSVSESIILPVISQPKAAPVIESVQEISDRALEAYVQSRGISLDLARIYLKEVAYRVDAHRFRALGFANDAGGFEVRNAAFKGSLGTKDISYLSKAESQQVAVFEGFFDFLSVLTHYKREQANANVLVLNSLALADKGIARLLASEIRHVYAYLDNDAAGRHGLARLRGQENLTVFDASFLYRGYKDANELLLKN
jgi:DNA primase